MTPEFAIGLNVVALLAFAGIIRSNRRTRRAQREIQATLDRLAAPPEGAGVDDPLQLDLLCAIVRLEQIADVGAGSSLGEFLLGRVITCDVPRLRRHLTAATIEWERADRDLSEDFRER